MWVPLRASCVQRLFIKQVSFKQIVSNSSESGVVCGRTLTTMEPSVLIFKWNLRPSVLNVDPQTEPSRRLMAAWTMLSQESSCVGTDENHNKILGPSSVLCPSLPAPQGGAEPHQHTMLSYIHSKSEKVCGTAFSVKKKCGKSAGHFWVILGPFWTFLGLFGPFGVIFGHFFNFFSALLQLGNSLLECMVTVRVSGSGVADRVNCFRLLAPLSAVLL